MDAPEGICKANFPFEAMTGSWAANGKLALQKMCIRDRQEQLNLFLLRCEKVYGAEKEEKTPAARLQGMIRRCLLYTSFSLVRR